MIFNIFLVLVQYWK